MLWNESYSLAHDNKIIRIGPGAWLYNTIPSELENALLTVRKIGDQKLYILRWVNVQKNL